MYNEYNTRTGLSWFFLTLNDKAYKFYNKIQQEFKTYYSAV